MNAILAGSATCIFHFKRFISFTQKDRPQGYPCSTQVSTKFILLINVKMPTIVVGILKFISMINTTSERLKARNVFICRFFVFMIS